MANEQLWAPWRMAYIQGEELPEPLSDQVEFLPGADRDCFMCQAVVDSANPRRRVIQMGEHHVVLLNRYPYNNGHLLLAPLEHLARLDELNAQQQLALTVGIDEMVGVLERVLHPQGFNIGLNLGRAAGAGTPGHLHWHIVPRWNGDTNFMPALAAVDMIPQSLDALWELLLSEIKGRAGE